MVDEPTGNLDSRTSREIDTLFAELAAEGQTVIMATHDPAAPAHATRTVHIADGCLVDGRALDAFGHRAMDVTHA